LKFMKKHKLPCLTKASQGILHSSQDTSGEGLPSRKRCFELLEQYRVPIHIRRHCITVAALATLLAHKLTRKAIPINTELVERTCLLHDILRVCDFDKIEPGYFRQKPGSDDTRIWQKLKNKYKHLTHEQAAYELFKKDYPKLAETIKKQQYISMANEKTMPKTWEEKLAYYADMKVMHDKVVPLAERLDDAHKRNVHLHGSPQQSRINAAKVDPLIYELEKEILSACE